MKLAIEGEHRQFFRKHHAIEFDGLLSNQQLEEINLAIQGALAERMGCKPQNVYLDVPEKLYTAGHDLWRSNETVKRLVLSSRFAEIASELIEFKPLRIGCDQLYPSIANHSRFSTNSYNPYKALITQPRSLKEISCLQGVLCGLMICLAGSEGEEREAPVKIFPSKAGNAVYFSPEAVFDFHELIQKQHHRYLLIVYTHPTAIYTLQETDPQTHELKRLGYVFGDRLSDKLNPIVYR